MRFTLQAPRTIRQTILSAYRRAHVCFSRYRPFRLYAGLDQGTHPRLAITGYAGVVSNSRGVSKAPCAKEVCEGRIWEVAREFPSPG
nr:MAG: hypothetical protein H3RhizoLitter141411_000001 [Mitovirus sp.]